MGYKELNKADIFLSSHVSQVYAPTYPLIKFLKSNCRTLISVLHPFTDSNLSANKIEFYLKKEKQKERTIPMFRAPFWIHFIKDFLITLFFAFFNINRFDIFIGVSSLDVLPGLIIKLFNRNKLVVYYSADYSTKRFNNPLINKLYLDLDRFCSRKVDFNWSVSERIREVKKKYGVTEARNILVPNGVHLASIKRRKFSEIEKNSLLFIGNLTKTKGVQDIILGFRQALAINKKLRLKIIGDGPYKKKLELLVKKENLKPYVQFLGLMSNKEILSIISKYAIGLAPYNLADDYTYYCDPVKVKEYLAASCPVIITDIPHVAQLIKQKKCGLVIKDFKKDLANAIKQILASDDQYQKFCAQAKKVSQKFDWDDIYRQAFKKMTGF